MILHLIYILAFSILALLAVSNLIRNLLMFSSERDRTYTAASASNRGNFSPQRVPHPEFLDNAGNLIKEPLLVMRSIDVEDAREHLDALYEASPGYQGETQEEI